MRYTVIYEKISEPTFEGEYYAHIPAFDLTTQGMGIEGAKAAAEDLLDAWIRSNVDDGEPLPPSDEDSFLGSIEVHADVLQNALQTA
jgi:predicted RNase H-like HicB family nuclease